MSVNPVYSQLNSVRAVFAVGRIRLVSLALALQISLLNLPHALMSNVSNEELLVISNEFRLPYLFRSIVFRDNLFRVTFSNFSVSSGRIIVPVPYGA